MKHSTPARLLFAATLTMLFFSTATAQSLSWNWARALTGPTNEDEIKGLAADPQGNVYIAGKFEDTVFIEGRTNPFVSAGMADIVLARYNANGKYIAARRFGGTGEDVIFDATLDSQKNLILSGYFQNTVIFGSDTLVSRGGFDMLVLKLNKRGQVLWARQYGGTGDEGGNEVAIGSNDQIIVGAQSAGTFIAGTDTFQNTGAQDAYLLSITAGGTVNWVRSIEGTGNARAKSVTVDQHDNVYLGGDFRNANNVITPTGSIPLSTFGKQDAYMTSWTSNGDYRWSKSWGGSGNDICKGVRVTAQDEVYLVGYFENTVSFEGTSLTAVQNRDIYVWQLDSTQSTNWLRRVGSTRDMPGAEIVMDEQDGVLFGIGMDAAVTFDDTSNTSVTLAPPGSGNWPALVRYNLDGSFNTLLIADNSDNATFGEIARGGDRVYLDVVHVGSVTFASDVLTSSSPNNKEGGLVSATVAPLPPAASKTQITARNFALYPNPTSDFTRLNLGPGLATVVLMDPLGRVLQKHENVRGVLELNSASLKSGLYLIEVVSEGEHHRLNLIRQ